MLMDVSPGAPDRGGVKEDTDNYVALLREMRASFGTQFGISIAIPSSYWYLRWFKPKEMQQYVDWFGIMTYDLHGPWDEKVSQIGKFVLGHTNIPEIYNWTQPLWYDGVDPAKVNMGLAYYARGYTVSDSNCNAVGCSWSGTSRPAPCTNFGGVMSLQEIENQIIPQLGVQPHLLEKDMMMELKWGNQWIGYDNKQTIAMKKTWASQHCFGGTMIWSVDFYSGSGSGDTPDGGGSTHPGNPGQGNPGDGSGNVYIDPSIYKDPNPIVYCEPPCTLILPPLVLSTSTTIKFPPYTTSLDVAWSASTGWTSIVQTTVLTIPPVSDS
jgi:chitinase